MRMNGSKFKKLVTILGVVACVCCIAVFSFLFAKDASNLSPSSIASSEISGSSGSGAAGIAGFEFDESGIKGRADSEVNSEGQNNQSAQQAADATSSAAQLSQASYEERMAASKEMAMSVGKPVSTQGVLSSLDRSGMGSVDASDEGVTYMTGQVIVLFSDGVSFDLAKSVLAKYGLSADDQHIQDCLDSQAPLLAITEYGKSVADVLDAIKDDISESAIAFAQPNFIYVPVEEIEQLGNDADRTSTEEAVVRETPEHPLSTYSSKLNVNDPKFQLWNTRFYEGVHIQEAWSIAKTNGKIAVAVLDNGVVDHPDLVDNIIPGTGYNANYGNDDYQGTGAGSCVDTEHGTHVAGIVAAGANNGIGTIGLSYNAGIIPIDVSVVRGNQKHIASWTIANALAYLLEDSDHNGKSDMVEKYNLRVINMSLGSRNYSSDAWSETYKRLVFPYIDALYEQGVLTVCAAGNDGIPNEGLKNATIPADYDKCMSVINANTDRGSAPSRSTDSNYGTLKDISAPGNCITSTTYSFDKTTGAIKYNYWESWGTSMASPAVAGIAALVFSVNPDLTPAQVQDILQSTATSSSGIPGFDIQLGWGLVNAEAAVIKAKETTGGNSAIKISVPTAATGLIYNGSVQTGVAGGEGYDVQSGTAKNAGNYTAIVTPRSGYAWSDGTTTSKNVAFSIAPATLTATYVGERVAAGTAPTYNVSVSGFVAGEWSGSAAGYIAPRVTPPSKLEPGSSYNLTPSGGSATNYRFNYIGGMLEVAPLIAEQTPSVSVNYAAETLTGFTSGAKYIIDNSEYIASGVTASEGSVPMQNSWFGKRISVAKVGNNVTTSNSPVVFVDVPAKPSIPANQLVVKNETLQGMSDGRITGVSQNMEYRATGTSEWIICPNGSIESLSPGDYEIRLRATSSSFAGNIIKLPIGVGAEPTCVLSIANIHFDPVVYGYAEENLKQLEITNTGNSTAKIERVELKGIDAAAFDLLGDLSEVAPGETNKSLSIAARSGLNAGEYQAVVMITYNDGKIAFVNMNFKVSQKPLEAPDVYIDYKAETFNGLISGKTYLLNQQEYVSQNNQLPISPEMFGNTVSIVEKSKDANYCDSAAKQVTVPTRSAAPLVQVRHETMRGDHDGAILGTTSDMEYRASGNTGWTVCSAGNVESLAPSEYEVRIRATNQSFAGDIASVRINEGTERTYILEVSGIQFAPVVYGYTSQEPMQLSVKNTGNSTATVESVTIEGTGAQAFQISNKISSIAPGETNGSLSVTPRDGLNAGEYQANVVITHSDGQSAFAEVSFRVLQKPMEAPNVSINYEAEAFDGLVDGQAYLISQREYVAQNGQVPIHSEMFGNTVSVIAKGKDANHCNSAAKQVTVPKCPAAPSVGVRDESAPNMGDGAILGTTSKMEYRTVGVDGGSSGGSSTEWIACSEGNTESLLPGDYDIRFRSTDKSFAGDITTVHINVGVIKPTYILSISDTQFASAVYGYGPQSPVQLSITNTGNSVALIKSVTLEGEDVNTDAFHLEGALSKIDPGESVSQLSVVPREGLGVGNYSADVVVTYTGENHDEKKVSGSVSFQVSPKTMDKPDVRIDYRAETFSGLAEGITYLFDQQEYEPQNGQVSISSKMFGHSVSVVAKSSDSNHLNSVAKEIFVPIRHAAPKVGVRDESVQGTSDGAIFGVTSDMEYRAVRVPSIHSAGASGAEWIACPDGNIESLSPGDYEVRFRATDASFASNIANIRVGQGAERTCILNLSSGYASAIYGYNKQDPIRINVSNTGNSAALISEITLEGENSNEFSLKGSIPSVSPGQVRGPLYVTPRTGLDMGEYKTKVVVAYDHGKKAFVEVSFRVFQKPMDTPNVSVDYGTEAFSGLISGKTYLINQREYMAQQNGYIDIPSNMLGKKISVVAKSDGANYCDSAAVQINVPVRPAAPKVEVRDESAAGANDGAILGTTHEMEYRVADGVEWKQCSENNTESLSPGDYLVRTKASESSFVSENARVSVKAGKLPDPVSSDEPKPGNQEPDNQKPSNQGSGTQEPNNQGPNSQETDKQESNKQKPDSQEIKNQEPNVQVEEAASDDVIAEDLALADTENRISWPTTNGTAGEAPAARNRSKLPVEHPLNGENSEVLTSTVQPAEGSMAAASEDSDSGFSTEQMILATAGTLVMISVPAAAATYFIRIRRP